MSQTHDNMTGGLEAREAGIAAGIYPPSELSKAPGLQPIELSHPLFEFATKPSGRFLTTERLVSFITAGGAVTEGAHLLAKSLVLGNTLEEKCAALLLTIGIGGGSYAFIRTQPSHG